MTPTADYLAVEEDRRHRRDCLDLVTMPDPPAEVHVAQPFAGTIVEAIAYGP